MEPDEGSIALYLQGESKKAAAKPFRLYKLRQHIQCCIAAVKLKSKAIGQFPFLQDLLL